MFASSRLVLILDGTHVHIRTIKLDDPDKTHFGAGFFLRKLRTSGPI